MLKKQSKNSYAFILSSILVVVPVIAFAQVKTLATVISIIIGYFNQVLFLLVGLAVVIFVYYIIQYFIRPNEDRTNAGQYVMYSLIGFFVILSLWGLVNILQNTFGLQNEANRPASWTSFKGLFPASGGTGASGAGGGFQVPSGASGAGGGNQVPNYNNPYGQEPNPTTGANMGANGSTGATPQPVMMAPYIKNPAATKGPVQ